MFGWRMMGKDGSTKPYAVPCPWCKECRRKAVKARRKAKRAAEKRAAAKKAPKKATAPKAAKKAPKRGTGRKVVKTSKAKISKAQRARARAEMAAAKS